MTRLGGCDIMWPSLGRLQRGLFFYSHLRTTTYPTPMGCQQSPRAVGFPRMSAQTAGGPRREGSVDSPRQEGRNPMAQIPLSQGKFATVDDADLEWLSRSRWSVCKHGCKYAVRRTRRDGKATTERMHRAIMDAPPGMQVDHINGDTLDNRRCNLRLCTNGQNKQNSRGSRKSSPYKGVILSHGRWVASIRRNGRTIYLGQYGTPEDAARAYDSKARELFGEFARCNFPED